MAFLYTMMATGGGIGEWIPLIVASVIGVILIIAFCIGLKKGVRRVSWTGICWLVACVAFFLIRSALGKNAEFSVTLVVALACVFIVLLGNGLLSIFFREEWKTEKRKRTEEALAEAERTQNGDWWDCDEYDERKKKEGEKPSVAGRIFGGIVCLINVGAVLFAIVCSVLLIISATPLKDGALESVFANGATQGLLSFSQKYLLDAVFIGIFLGFVCEGARNGLVGTFRTLLAHIGGILLTVACLLLPFSPLAGENGVPVLHNVVAKFADICNGWWGEKLPVLAPLLGKAFVGVLLAIIAVLIAVFFNWLLKKAEKGVVKIMWLRIVDGGIAGILYLVFAVVMCAVIWGVLYALAYYGVMSFSALSLQETWISEGVFELFETHIKPILDGLGR